MFLVILKYVKPLNEVEDFLPEHVNFLEKYYEQKKFILSGRRNPRDGGIILMNLNTKSEVDRIISEDPFYRHNIAEYDVIEFLPTKYDARFECFIDQ